MRMRELNQRSGVKLPIQEFDYLYAEKVPSCYKLLNDDYQLEDIDKLKAELKVDYLPEEYLELYQWENGSPVDFEDRFYDQNGCDEDECLRYVYYRFLSIEAAISLVNMWSKIKNEKDQNEEVCYWENGFIPLFDMKWYGLVVIGIRHITITGEGDVEKK